uniref:Uncharacterized protein n=1 Tax=Setaria digitata TaxID=48799 RepID=A0A915PVC8_9BILA
MIQKLNCRYECEEDEFLRELEGMQGQVSERTSLCDEVPILGALCSLVGEISKLRRENKALRYRLSIAIEPKRSVVHRVSAILESRSNIIPKIMGRRAFHQGEIRNGARERLSTPPHKESLTTSSYSTDISSDVSDPHRVALTPTTQIRVPPVVLPEMSDSDAEHSIFTEVALPNYGNSAVRDGRTAVRCSKVSSMSERTSPSSASSRDHSENMSKNIYEESNGNKHSLLQAPRQYYIQRQQKGQESKKSSRGINSTTVSEESDDDHQSRSSSAPKTIFSQSHNGSKSMSQQKRFLSRGSSENGWISVNSCTILDENETMRNELIMIKNRNNRLIEQLREKSMEHSKLATQIGILRNRCRLNEALEKLSISDRMINKATATIDSVEEKLKIFDNKLQAVKAEMMKNGQAITNQSFREQNAYQSCLEHIERLQRENFSMLQDRGSEIGNHDQRIRQLLEIMPSYDALYSFTINIVRKLGQLRASYIEKNIGAYRSDFEVMRAQSSLLVTHAQLERLKLQLCAATGRRIPRPASYHGEDLLQKTIKPQMNFLLPFKLHGSRIRKHRRSDSCLSRISEFTGVNKTHLERAGISNSNSYARDDLKSTTVVPQQSNLIQHREQLFRNSPGKIHISQRNHKTQSTGRPVSLVETEDRMLINGNISHFSDCVVKKTENKQENSSPILKVLVNSYEILV